MRRRPLDEVVGRPGVDDAVELDLVAGGLVAAEALPLELARARGRRCRCSPCSPTRVPGRAGGPGGSWRSGRQLISTAVSKRAHAAKTISGSNVDSGRTSSGSEPTWATVERSLRPVQWPRMSTWGLATASTSRRVMASRSMRSFEWALATTTSSRASRSRSWSSEPSSRMSTSMPVRMRNGARRSLSPADLRQLLVQAVGRQAVSHGQPGRVVGQDEVVVAQLDGGAGHRLDGRPAVGPEAVAVAVAPQRLAIGAAGLAQRDLGRRLELDDPLGHLAVARPR